LARAVGPADRAEDAVQQALLQAYRALRRHDDVGELRPWLRRIVRNASVDLSRRTGPPPEAVREEELVGESVEPALERRHQLARLVKALRQLPERQREAIVMRELEGRPFEEIASEFGTSKGGARQLVRRARAQLRAGVAGLAPPALLARILAYSAPQADGIGVGAKLGAAMAVGGSAVVVGTFAPSLDQPMRQSPANRHRPAQGEPAKPPTATQPPRPLTTVRPPPAPVRQPAARPIAPEQHGSHDGGHGDPAAEAAVSGGSHTGQGEQAGAGEQVQQGGGGHGQR
jgi:RNA polymerase sigma factor (sigma-70 family)